MSLSGSMINQLRQQSNTIDAVPRVSKKRQEKILEFARLGGTCEAESEHVQRLASRLARNACASAPETSGPKLAADSNEPWKSECLRRAMRPWLPINPPYKNI